MLMSPEEHATLEKMFGTLLCPSCGDEVSKAQTKYTFCAECFMEVLGWWDSLMRSPNPRVIEPNIHYYIRLITNQYWQEEEEW